MLQAAQMVANDIGIAIIDPFIGHIMSKNDILIKPLEPYINFDYAYIWPEGRELSALAKEFIVDKELLLALMGIETNFGNYDFIIFLL